MLNGTTVHSPVQGFARGAERTHAPCRAAIVLLLVFVAAPTRGAQVSPRALEQASPVRVAGRVLDESSRALPGARVSIVVDGRVSVTTWTD